MDSPLMSIRAAGEYLGYSGKSRGRSSIYEHIKNQRLIKVRLQGRSFVTKDSADQLISNNSCET